jgi:uncharacterized protein HemX
MSTNPILPQPDFNLINESRNQLARAHRDLANETKKLQNLPAIDSAAAIIAALVRIESKIDELQIRQIASYV